MPAPATNEEFLEVARKSGVVDEQVLARLLQERRDAGTLPDRPDKLAAALLRAGILTRFQVQQFLQGKWRRFIIAGKYKLLEHLGTGGMGMVYLCEHMSMRRRVAIKVLPVDRAQDNSSLDRFYREARAVAALDHPNIVRAYDIDHDDKLHFLVMEYVDGSSMHQIVSRHGPMDVTRAAHYVAQAAYGLQAAADVGVVHRDIKPANLLVDRSGTVKILDMGLARFFNDQTDNLSKQYEENVLGTADYLSPEQTRGSDVDIRADIYSLGATFYFLLTGQPPFTGGTTAMKLIWHQTRVPKPVRELRAEVPEGMAAVVERMLAKEPEDRYQMPLEVADALAEWTATPIPPPPDEEMPQLSPAATTAADGSPVPGRPTGSRSPNPRRFQGLHAAARGNSGTPTPGVTAAVASPSPLPGASRVLPTTGNATPSAAGRDTTPDNGRLPSAETPADAPRPRKRLSAWWAAVGGAAAVAAVVAAVLFWPPPRPSGDHRSTDHVASGSSMANANQQVGASTKHVANTGTTGTYRAAHPQPGAEHEHGGVKIEPRNGGFRVETVPYEADIDPDGCLTSLRIGGIEFLRPGVDISRGVYFVQDPVGVLKLPTLEQVGSNVVRARGERAEIRYEFGDQALVWSPRNLTDQSMNFFLVFDRAVTAVAGGQGEWAYCPVGSMFAPVPWKATTWYAGGSKLTVHGASAIWGWVANTQVCQLVLSPKATCRLLLEVGETSPAEVARFAPVPTASPLSAKQVRVTERNHERTIHAPGYEATVAADGCLTRLRAGGVDWLLTGHGTIARGVYVFDTTAAKENKNPMVPLPLIAHAGPKVLTAGGDKASVRYEFGDRRVRWTATNRTNRELVAFMVFTTAVKAVAGDNGETVRTPNAAKMWPRTSWYAGRSKLTVRGGTRLWGPWMEGYQVWQLDLPPNLARTVLLTWGPMSAAEDQRVNPLISLDTPGTYQVFQRQTPLRGRVAFRGRVRPDCDKVEVRLAGMALDGRLPDRWQTLAVQGPDHRFEGAVSTPAGGWYAAEVRARRGDKVVARFKVDKVGVGEVLVTAGQSNATNYGETLEVPQDDRVVAWNGHGWQPARDPQPNSAGSGGTPWPVLGDLLVRRLRVPVGFVAVGAPGSTVQQWQPGGPLYGHLKEALVAQGKNGVRCVLWHQGESDTLAGTSATDYAERLRNILRQSRADAGYDVTWFIAGVAYIGPQHRAKEAAVRRGQQMAQNGKDTLAGPTTDDLLGDCRHSGDHIHFSDKGLREHARRWFDVLMKTAYQAEVSGE
jgi:serine/threonine protein kinase